MKKMRSIGIKSETATNGTALKASVVLLLLFVFGLVSCESNLLSSPPAATAIVISDGPTVLPATAGATISWKTNRSTKMYVEYGTSSGTYTHSVPPEAAATLNHTLNLSSLSYSTTYYYRVVSFGGTSTFYSTEFTFTSAASPTDTFALTATPVSTPASNTVMITWDSNIASTFSLEYGTATGTYTGATPHSSSLTLSHSASLSGLSSSTTYYYRVVSGIGLSRYNSAEYTFATTAATTLNVSSGPTATPTTSSLSIAWTTNAACKDTLEYGTVAGTYTNSMTISASATTSHTVNITGLSSGTTYYYRLWLIGTTENATSIEYSAATTAETEPTLAKKNRGIWVIGGISGSAVGSAVGSVDLYDPVTNAWHAAVTTLPTAVSFAGYAAYGGKLYVFGGFTSAGAVSNLVQIYTISTGLWSSGTVMTAARANIHAVVMFDTIYILGGTTGAASAAWAASLTSYEYTPTAGAGSWATRTAFSAANVSERFAYTYDNVIYNIGGRNAAATVAAAAHDGLIYSTSALTSGSTEVAMSTPRSGVAGSVFKTGTAPGALVLVGGVSTFAGTTGCFVNQGTTTPTLSNLVQYLSYPFAGAAAWTASTDTFPSLIAYGAAVVSTAVSPARFYHFGGTSSLAGTASGQNSVYYTTAPQPPSAWTANWASATNMSTGRWGHGAVTLNQ